MSALPLKQWILPFLFRRVFQATWLHTKLTVLHTPYSVDIGRALNPPESVKRLTVTIHGTPGLVNLTIYIQSDCLRGI